jgi:NRAMP (natural resistance-associated macrophage protein)-like metal ion transporter
MKDFFEKIKSHRIFIILAIIGPGIITANVDNDAGGIATYSIAGAKFGNSLLWTLIPITLILIIVQEMAARMAVVTGKGLADLIREKYGVRAIFYLIILLLIADFGNTIAEFAGLAAAMELLGVSKYITVPIGAFGIWYMVVKGTYRSVEKIFMFACLIYVTYIISGFMAKPVWPEVMRSLVIPELDFTPGYLMMLIGIIGATVAPWMQFYMQASYVEKGTEFSNYKIIKWDVIIGCFLTNIVAFFIIVACSSTLFKNSIAINSASEAALALKPLAGKYASILFAIGLANASLFAASILPLTTAYYICEGMGWNAGVNKSIKEAPQFFGLYTGIILFGALFVLIPKLPLLFIMYLTQVINGLVLPFVLIFIIKIINDKDIMGEHINSKFANVVSYTTIIFLIIITLLMVAMALF